MNRRCPRCNGTGYESVIGATETCPSCIGLGRDLKSDLWSEPCRTCNGRGRIQVTRVACGQCRSRGTIDF